MYKCDFLRQNNIQYKGQRFYKESVLDMRTHFKPTETFQYTFFTSCHPLGVKKGFVKGEALRLLTTNSSIKTFEEDITKFKKDLTERGYPQTFINNAQIGRASCRERV